MRGMFSNRSNAYDALTELDSVIRADEPIFHALISQLEAMGVFVTHAVSVNRQSSHAISSVSGVVEPSLKLFIRDTETFVALGGDEHDGNWSCKWSCTQSVRAMWKTLCQEYQISANFYSDEMFVFVYNGQRLRLGMLTRDCKSRIEAYLAAAARRQHPLVLAPKYVFVSSHPVISVVYPTKEDLHVQRSTRLLAQHEKQIFRILRDSDRWNCFCEDQVRIQFLDAETSSDRLYGLSRED